MSHDIFAVDAPYRSGRDAIDQEESRSSAGSAQRGVDAHLPAALSPGLIVILIARWILIGAGFLITLWSPSEGDLGPTKITLGLLFGLAVGNFFLHAQFLMKRPLPSSLTYASSALDIGIVTAIIAIYHGGPATPLFVFYYPALLALALVFPARATTLFTAGMVFAYFLVGSIGPLVARTVPEADVQVFFARTVSLAAVAVIGVVYQAVERRRCAQDQAPMREAGPVQRVRAPENVIA